MTAPARFALLAAVVAAALSACGQTGPLSLPEDARPIERAEPATTQPDQTDDERQDER
jgi:predicted small lipoprotein YifL